MAVAFPNKEILIGETGWPSEGRMREGALPSRTNQARVVAEILALAKQQNFRVNLIEAYDQPWKRRLEGTVGGYWGLFDSVHRALKYPPGENVSNFPFWRWQMGGGMAFSLIVFVSAWLTTRRRPWTPRLASWIAVALIATSAGTLIGLAADKMYYESYGIGGWVQWGLLLAAGVVASVLGANAVVSGRSLPTFLDLFGPRSGEGAGPAPSMCCLGASLVATVLIGSETALGFVFDPRYRDFPFASLTMAAVPFACLLLNRPQNGVRPIAEAAFAGLFAASAVYVGVNEGRDNWQSLWTCAVYLLLAFTLWRARGAQSPG
jgi:glucan 1,3-beta-glucosidase